MARGYSCFSRYDGHRRPRATNPCSCSALSATSEAAPATEVTASVVAWAVAARPATLVLISFVVAVCSSTAPATDVLPVTDPVDQLGDALDRGGGLSAVFLEGEDLLGDAIGGGGGLPGKVLDLAGDDREALSRLAGPSSLDGGVECQ